ncbi:MAG: AtzH-like domain-containing protein [Trichodesmium sp.]
MNNSVTAAFEKYESALIRNNVDVLDELFLGYSNPILFLAKILLLFRE